MLGASGQHSTVAKMFMCILLILQGSAGYHRAISPFQPVTPAELLTLVLQNMSLMQVVSQGA